MSKPSFAVGDTVAFAQAVVRRSGDQLFTSRARGTVVDVTLNGRIVAVDWGASWLPHEETGSSVRHVPSANLTRVLSNGAVFGD